MMIAVDNKLPQPPNAAWQALPPPYGQQIAFTDANKAYAWIGYVADADAGLPNLPASGQIVTPLEPAFWSNLADQ